VAVLNALDGDLGGTLVLGGWGALGSLLGGREVRVEAAQYSRVRPVQIKTKIKVKLCYGKR
jgi:hypothetical protein